MIVRENKATAHVSPAINDGQYIVKVRKIVQNTKLHQHNVKVSERLLVGDV